MNKKNKTKKTRKLLPVLLCIVLMLSMFTLSAFAEETECEHIWVPAQFSSDFKQFTVECQECKLQNIYYAYSISDAPEKHCDNGAWEYRYPDAVVVNEDGTAEMLLVYFCTCDEDTYMRSLYGSLTPPIVDTPEAENVSIITSITTDLVGSIGVFLGGIGESLVTFFDNVVTTTNAEGKRTLTTFAGWSIAFLGIGFGSMFIRKLMKKAS